MSVPAGHWQLRRRYSTGLRAQGFATITVDGAYHEQAAMLWPDGQTTAGERRYRIEAAGTKLRLYYADGLNDGELFQSFDLAQPRGWSQHLCGADCYRSRWHRIGPDSFSLIHLVDGPRKEYRMHSLYRRVFQR